jgi:hypothetical protein
MNTLYMQQLLSARDQYQDAIERLLEEYSVTPVGNGYMDLVVARGKASELIQKLARLPVAVEGMSWWCHVTPESRARLGCPHGYGGPANPFGPGHFSETNLIDLFKVAERGVDLDATSFEPRLLASECGRIACNYIERELPAEKLYSPCLQPGLWLLVPDGWRRRRYFVRGS